nr:LuxR C-terminal-related transcriptional regulator [Nocardiopsis dassonvillei]
MVAVPAVNREGSRTDAPRDDQGDMKQTEEILLEPEEVSLLAEIATGVTTEVAARHLGVDARTLRRRVRGICDKLNVHTPIEAVVWAAKRQII